MSTRAGGARIAKGPFRRGIALADVKKPVDAGEYAYVVDDKFETPFDEIRHSREFATLSLLLSCAAPHLHMRHFTLAELERGLVGTEIEKELLPPESNLKYQTIIDPEDSSSEIVDILVSRLLIRDHGLRNKLQNDEGMGFEWINNFMRDTFQHWYDRRKHLQQLIDTSILRTEADPRLAEIPIKHTLHTAVEGVTPAEAVLNTPFVLDAPPLPPFFIPSEQKKEYSPETLKALGKAVEELQRVHRELAQIVIRPEILPAPLVEIDVVPTAPNAIPVPISAVARSITAELPPVPTSTSTSTEEKIDVVADSKPEVPAVTEPASDEPFVPPFPVVTGVKRPISSLVTPNVGGPSIEAVAETYAKTHGGPGSGSGNAQANPMDALQIIFTQNAELPTAPPAEYLYGGVPSDISSSLPIHAFSSSFDALLAANRPLKRARLGLSSEETMEEELVEEEVAAIVEATPVEPEVPPVSEEQRLAEEEAAAAEQLLLEQNSIANTRVKRSNQANVNFSELARGRSARVPRGTRNTPEPTQEEINRINYVKLADIHYNDLQAARNLSDEDVSAALYLPPDEADEDDINEAVEWDSFFHTFYQPCTCKLDPMADIIAKYTKQKQQESPDAEVTVSPCICGGSTLSESPLERARWTDLPLRRRIQLLLALLEARVCNTDDDIGRIIAMGGAEDAARLRPHLLGRDANGAAYYSLPPISIPTGGTPSTPADPSGPSGFPVDLRVYREIPVTLKNGRTISAFATVVYDAASMEAFLRSLGCPTSLAIPEGPRSHAQLLQQAVSSGLTLSAFFESEESARDQYNRQRARERDSAAARTGANTSGAESSLPIALYAMLDRYRDDVLLQETKNRTQVKKQRERSAPRRSSVRNQSENAEKVTPSSAPVAPSEGSITTPNSENPAPESTTEGAVVIPAPPPIPVHTPPPVVVAKKPPKNLNNIDKASHVDRVFAIAHFINQLPVYRRYVTIAASTTPYTLRETTEETLARLTVKKEALVIAETERLKRVDKERMRRLREEEARVRDSQSKEERERARKSELNSLAKAREDRLKRREQVVESIPKPLSYEQLYGPFGTLGQPVRLTVHGTWAGDVSAWNKEATTFPAARKAFLDRIEEMGGNPAEIVKYGGEAAKLWRLMAPPTKQKTAAQTHNAQIVLSLLDHSLPNISEIIGLPRTNTTSNTSSSSSPVQGRPAPRMRLSLSELQNRNKPAQDPNAAAEVKGNSPIPLPLPAPSLPNLNPAANAPVLSTLTTPSTDSTQPVESVSTTVVDVAVSHPDVVPAPNIPSETAESADVVLN